MTIFNSFLFVYQRVSHEFTHLPNPKNAIVYAKKYWRLRYIIPSLQEGLTFTWKVGKYGEICLPLVVKHGNGKATIYNTLS